jgi:hypothetical protein
MSEALVPVMLEPLATDVWTARRPLRMFGVELGTRMTIVRLQDGSLFVHSPVALDAALRQAVDALGPVRFIAAPNRWHHLFAGDWAAAYPAAALYGVPGLPEKRPDLSFAAVLRGDERDLPWSSSLAHRLVEGAPIMNEVAFFHRASGTLLVSDLAFNIGPDSPWLTRTLCRAIRQYDRLEWSWAKRRLFARDRDALQRSVTALLDWEPERVVLAHGRIVEDAAATRLRAAFGWLLDPGRRRV